MSKILIIGGAGFGGSGLTVKLLEKGYSVGIMDVVAPSHATLLKDVIDRVKYIWKSVHEVSRCDVEGYDVVLHFAAQADVPMGFSSPHWTFYENVMGTVALMESCRKVKLDKVFIASSANAVQRPLYLPIDHNHPPTPSNPYGASKGCQELIAWAWYRSYGVPIVIYRNGIIYGPNMRREIFIFKWLWNILHGKPCVLEGGLQTRDPTYVSDTIDAWMLGIEAEREKVVGQVFQVSYGKEYTVEEILYKCFEACGVKVDPYSSMIVRMPYRLGEEGMREYFDISKAKRILGYSPKVDLDTGLRLTVEWLKSLY